MATERLTIQVDEKGALVVKKNIESVGGSAKESAGAVTLLKRALAALAGATIVRQLVGLADEFTNIQNRLRLVTDGQGQLASVTEELFQISKRTRAEFSATAELYQKVALSAGELGISQKELFQFTESLNQAIILSGSDAQTASGGIRQLAQGIAAGALRGDELISVLENLPAVAQIIAKQLGITVGTLRVLGSQGKITSDIILQAFRDQREEIDTRYNKTITTIGQAFTLLKNNVVRFVGELGASSGATATLANSIGVAASAVDTLRGYTNALTVAVATLAVTIGIVKFLAWAKAASGATTVIGALTAGTNSLKAGMAGLAGSLGPVGAALLAIGTAASVATLYFDKLKQIQTEIEAIEERSYRARLARVQAQVKEIQEKKIAEKALKDYVGALKEELNTLKLTKREAAIQASIDKAAALAKRDLTTAEQQQIRSLYDQRDALQRQRDLLEEIRGPQQEYRQQLEALEAIKPQLTANEYANALKQIQETYAKLNNTDLPKPPKVPDAPTFQPLDTLAETVRDLKQESVLLKLSGDERERRAEILRLENQLLSQNKKLSPDDRRAVEDLIRENQGLARRNDLIAQLNDVEARYGVTLAITDQVMQGGSVSAEKYAEILGKIDATVTEFTNKQQTFTDVFNSVWDSGLSAIHTFVEGGEGAFRQFATSALSSISDILAGLLKIQAQKAIASALGFNLPGNATGASFMVGGSGGTDSQVVAFRASPNERVDVLTPAQQRAQQPPVAAAPSPSAPRFKIVNVLDPNEIREAMSAEEGEQVVINTLRRNKTVAQQVLS